MTRVTAATRKEAAMELVREEEAAPLVGSGRDDVLSSDTEMKPEKCVRVRARVCCTEMCVSEMCV